MPKIFKDPSRHIKPSDHRNKPHITLVNGMPVKNLASYIFNGIKEISDENIIRSTSKNGYSIIYFTDPKKTFESSIFRNNSDIKEARAKLKFFIAGLAHNLEKNIDSKNNLKIQIALNSLRELAHDFDRDIKISDLKNPLEIILNEITTPKELKRKKITSPYKSMTLYSRGINRQALSRFNKMGAEELNNLINFIFSSIKIHPTDVQKMSSHASSAKQSIQCMQKFIEKYLQLGNQGKREFGVRTITTSELVYCAKNFENLKDLKIFCEAWAKARKSVSSNSGEGVSALFGWRKEVDAVVAVLNKRLFQAQSASTPYSNIFKPNSSGVDTNIFLSPNSPTGALANNSNQSPVDTLSPGLLIEDSAEKKLLETINKATPKISGNVKRTIQFSESPIQLISESIPPSLDTANVEPKISRLMSSPSILSPELIEKLQTSIDSNSEDYESFRSPIYSPSVFLQRQPSLTTANQQAIEDEELNQLIADLSIELKSSARFNNFDNENIEDNLNSEEINYLTNTNYGNIERTPEKPDLDALQSLQNKIQTTVRKASSKLTYEPMPTQQVLNTNPNPSITNAINNSINNRN